MKDFFGQELTVGDEVIFIESAYRHYRKGTITKISDVKCTIAHTNKWNRNVLAMREGVDVIKSIIVT